MDYPNDEPEYNPQITPELYSAYMPGPNAHNARYRFPPSDQPSEQITPKPAPFRGHPPNHPSHRGGLPAQFFGGFDGYKSQDQITNAFLNAKNLTKYGYSEIKEAERQAEEANPNQGEDPQDAENHTVKPSTVEWAAYDAGAHTSRAADSQSFPPIRYGSPKFDEDTEYVGYHIEPQYHNPAPDSTWAADEVAFGERTAVSVDPRESQEAREELDDYTYNDELAPPDHDFSKKPEDYSDGGTYDPEFEEQVRLAMKKHKAARG